MLRRTFVLAAAAALFPRKLRPAGTGSCFATFDPEEKVWAIGNSQVKALFRLEREGMFRFLEFNAPDGRVWSAPAGELSSPISLTAGGVELDPLTTYDLVETSTTPIERSGLRLTCVLQARSLPARIRFEADVHEGHPFLRYRVILRNTSSNPFTVTEADMLAWRFKAAGSQFRALYVGQWSWGGEKANFEPHEVDLTAENGPIEAFTGAYGDHATWGAIADQNENGLAFGWEFDGRARAHAEHLAGRDVVIVDSFIQKLAHTVRPGDEFAVPGAFFGAFQGDWDEAGFRTQRFVEDVLAAHVPASEAARLPYVAFDSWGYQWDINETVLLDAARRAASIGVELFTVDFGWAKVTGDWRPDPEKFPNGLRPLSDYVHSLGMKFGLHLPFGEAMPQSDVLTRHPDWAVVPSPNQARGYFGALGLCLSHQPVREWVVSEILRVVREYDVDWLLQDGENMVKNCLSTSHTHDAGDSNYSNSVEGLNAVIEAVQHERPELMWENCEDGGNMQTFHMVQHYVTSIVNDNADYLVTRQSIYGATFPFPPRYTDRYMQMTPWDNYSTRSHFFGGPLIIMSTINDWPDFMVDFTKSEIAIYKTIRRHIAEGKVYHITPRPDGSFNDAIQSHHQQTDSSVILVFRHETPTDSEMVFPRGHRPDRMYRVRFQEAQRAYTASGAELAQAGIRVDLPLARFAEIVYISPEA